MRLQKASKKPCTYNSAYSYTESGFYPEDGGSFPPSFQVLSRGGGKLPPKLSDTIQRGKLPPKLSDTSRGGGSFPPSFQISSRGGGSFPPSFQISSRGGEASPQAFSFYPEEGEASPTLLSFSPLNCIYRCILFVHFPYTPLKKLLKLVELENRALSCQILSCQIVGKLIWPGFILANAVLPPTLRTCNPIITLRV